MNNALIDSINERIAYLHEHGGNSEWAKTELTSLQKQVKTLRHLNQVEHKHVNIDTQYLEQMEVMAQEHLDKYRRLCTLLDRTMDYIATQLGSYNHREERSVLNTRFERILQDYPNVYMLYTMSQHIRIQEPTDG